VPVLWVTVFECVVVVATRYKFVVVEVVVGVEVVVVVVAGAVDVTVLVFPPTVVVDCEVTSSVAVWVAV
jgi:hypothetical protein